MKTRTVKIGEVGVDSGQLLICDPSYITSQWQTPKDNNADFGHEIYKHVEDGIMWQFVYGGKTTAKKVIPFPGTYEDRIPRYNKTPNQLIKEGLFKKIDKDSRPHIPDGEFSYRGICKATGGKDQSGQLNYVLGHAGAGVAFRSGFGDGIYNVYAEIVETEDYGERVSRVWVEMMTGEDINEMDLLMKKQSL